MALADGQRGSAAAARTLLMVLILLFSALSSDVSGSSEADGNETASNATLDVPAAGWSTVSRGGAHVCALEHETRNIKCWGDGWAGQLGHGSTFSSETPVDVIGAEDSLKHSAGGQHTCSVDLSGRAKCWGDNVHGQLGHGGLSKRSDARPVLRVDEAVDVAAGGSHTCILERVGTVKCFGMGEFGQLGDGTTTSSRYAQVVLGIDRATKICAGALHSCALEETGSVKCWGWAAHGQIGHGFAEELSSVPVAVPGVANAIDVACGYHHSCARLDDTSAICWGDGISQALQAEDFLQVWHRTAPVEMTLEEAHRNTFFPSPLGSACELQGLRCGLNSNEP